MVELLNEDLAGELQAVAQYNAYAAAVRGPMRLQLAELFRSEIPDELGHAEFLAEKVAFLGGTPVTSTEGVKVPTRAREMVEAVLEAELTAVKRYTERSKQAAEEGDLALQAQLEDMVREENDHAESMQKLLDGWT